MDAAKTVDVVHIPHNGGPMGIITLPLTLTTGFGTITTGCDQHEKHLIKVPDVRDNRYAGSRQFARKYRELVDLGNMDPEQNPRERYQQRGPYYMYRFSDGARKDLPDMLNKNFERAEGANSVYGNAFIFKVKTSASQSESGVAEYDNLDLSFIDSAFKGRGLSASESLKWLSKQ